MGHAGKSVAIGFLAVGYMCTTTTGTGCASVATSGGDAADDAAGADERAPDATLRDGTTTDVARADVVRSDASLPDAVAILDALVSPDGGDASPGDGADGADGGTGSQFTVCAAVDAPYLFAPTTAAQDNAGGANRPSDFGPGGGFYNIVRVYPRGTSQQLMLSENFGFSLYSLADPSHPAIRTYQDVRSTYPLAGDGQSEVFGLGAADDGSRAAVSLIHTTSTSVLLQPSTLSNFYRYAGNLGVERSDVTVDLNAGSYRMYGVHAGHLWAGVVDTFVRLSNPGTLHEIPSQNFANAPLGNFSTVARAGHYLIYYANSSLFVADTTDATSPTDLEAGVQYSSFSLASAGVPLGYPVAVAAAIEHDTGALDVLVVTLDASTPSPHFDRALLLRSASRPVALALVGTAFVPAPPAGEVYQPAGGADMVEVAGETLATFWLEHTDASGTGHLQQFVLSTRAWGTNLSPGADYAIVDPAVGPPGPMQFPPMNVIDLAHLPRPAGWYQYIAGTYYGATLSIGCR